MKFFSTKQTKRKKANAPLFNKNRALKVLRQCNKILFLAEKEQELLNEVCRIIVEAGGYRLAWVGYPENDKYKSIRPVAYCGYETGYLEALKLTWDDTVRGRGPAGIVVRTGKSCVVRDIHTDPDFIPWRKAAIERGYASVVAFPLFMDKELPTVILMYAVEPDAFDKDELELLENLSDSLAHGIEGIRVREKHRQAEEALLSNSEERFRALYDNNPLMLFTIDEDGKVLTVNHFGIDQLGYPKDQVVGKPVINVFYEEDKLLAQECLKQCFAEPDKVHKWELRKVHQDGSVIWVRETVRMVDDFDGKTTALVACEDITERKQVEEALLASEERYRSISMSSTVAMIISVDQSGIIISWNTAAENIFGYSEAEILGHPLLEIIPERYRTAHLEGFQRAAKTEEYRLIGKTVELHGLKKSGMEFPIELSLSTWKQGGTKYFSAIIHDITDRKQADEQLTYQASHDTLTGLVNRREFERRAERLLSTVLQDQSEHALCFMDLDQFKVVNDTCGHTAGDEMLRQLSSLLNNTVRHRDTLARLGGDEFAVLMEHCSLDDAHRVATTLLTAINDYQFTWEGHSFRVSVSMGLVPITDLTVNLTELLKQADAACYVAKDKGRNRIHVHHAEDSELAQRHGEMQWVERLNQALEDDRFCLYAQTIVPLNSSTDKHYELLLRMIDEKGGIIPPGAFLPAAERYNLTSKIDHWVIEHAFGLLADNPAFLKQIDLCSINLSGQSLTDPEILKFIITQLDESEIQGSKICFEVTETAAISNLSRAMKFISTLKELGCRFALDDFGSGLSSFGYLKNLPVDYLKIDGMFVKDIVDDPIDYAMVKSINEIGHVMGMQTIAEFVENDVIKGMLKEIGVDYAQGYGVGKPVAFDTLLNS